MKTIKHYILLLSICLLSTNILYSENSVLFSPYLFDIHQSESLACSRDLVKFRSELYTVGTAFHQYGFFASKYFKNRYSISADISGVRSASFQLNDLKFTGGFSFRFRDVAGGKMENIAGLTLAYKPGSFGEVTASGFAVGIEYYLRLISKISFIVSSAELLAVRFWESGSEILTPSVFIETSFHFHESNIFGIKVGLPDLSLDLSVRQRLVNSFYLNGGGFLQGNSPGVVGGFSVRIKSFYLDFNGRFQFDFVPVFQIGTGFIF